MAPSAGAATTFPPPRPLSRSATWPARATARKSAVLAPASPSSPTTAGSRLSSPDSLSTLGTLWAATQIRPRSAACLAQCPSLLSAAVPRQPSPTACRLARPRDSRTAALSTTRSALAATPLQPRPWRAAARILWSPVATSLARATRPRAAVVPHVSLCTRLMYNKASWDEKEGQIATLFPYGEAAIATPGFHNVKVTNLSIPLFFLSMHKR